MAISKFGQYVLLQVHNSLDEVIFQTDDLRVDFDILHIKDWSRAKFTIFNLAPSAIRRIGAGDSENYLTLSVRLHDGPIATIANRMYISNALEEVKVPQSEFYIYCYSKLRKAYLDNVVDVNVGKVSLRRTVKNVAARAGFQGEVEFRHFPQGYLDYVAPKPSSRQQGKLMQVLQNLGKEHSFNLYTIDNKLVLMYKPTSKNVAMTDLYTTSDFIKLSTTNMRDNPKIGPATLQVTSNLDARIIPSSTLDTSQLLTIGTDTDEETLQVAEDYLLDKVAGFSRYQALSVHHAGSNWTGKWQTEVTGTSPSVGTSMKTDKWWL